MTPMDKHHLESRGSGIRDFLKATYSLPSNFSLLQKEKASLFGYARLENIGVYVECTILVSRM